MTKNHRNRSWRSHWTCEPTSRTAVHKSGVTARVMPSPTDPTKDRITLENTQGLDLARWDLGALTEQAAKLWAEGAAEAARSARRDRGQGVGLPAEAEIGTREEARASREESSAGVK